VIFLTVGIRLSTIAVSCFWSSTDYWSSNGWASSTVSRLQLSN